MLVFTKKFILIIVCSIMLFLPIKTLYAMAPPGPPWTSEPPTPDPGPEPEEEEEVEAEDGDEEDDEDARRRRDRGWERYWQRRRDEYFRWQYKTGRHITDPLDDG